MARFGRGQPQAPILLRGKSTVPLRLGPQITVLLATRQRTPARSRNDVSVVILRNRLVPPVVVLPAPQVHLWLATRQRDRARVRSGSRVVVQRGVLWATISGITRDSTGATLGVCVVHLFRTSDDTRVGTTVSNAAGNYSFTLIADATTYYCVAYKVGSPDVAGTTVNTLVAA